MTNSHIFKQYADISFTRDPIDISTICIYVETPIREYENITNSHWLTSHAIKYSHEVRNTRSQSKPFDNNTKFTDDKTAENV